MPKKRNKNDPPRFRSVSRNHSDSQNWEPILALVGTELTGWFMWMGSLVLEDGAVVHAYKHRQTRGYVHIAEDGRTFYYDWDGETVPNPDPSYVQIDRGAILFAVLRRWDTSRLGPDARMIEQEIDLAYDAADEGRLLPVDPNELRLQREFEARSAEQPDQRMAS